MFRRLQHTSRGIQSRGNLEPPDDKPVPREILELNGCIAAYAQTASVTNFLSCCSHTQILGGEEIT